MRARSPYLPPSTAAAAAARNELISDDDDDDDDDACNAAGADTDADAVVGGGGDEIPVPKMRIQPPAVLLLPQFPCAHHRFGVLISTAFDRVLVVQRD
jgi:hypothetical protein